MNETEVQPHEDTLAPGELPQAVPLPEGQPPAHAGRAEALAGALVAPAVVPRWVQLVLAPLAIVGLWELAGALGQLLVVVLGAAVIALILNPLARQIERLLPRGLAIAASYLAILLVFAGIGLLLSAPVTDQLTHFTNHLPQFVRRVNHDLLGIQTFLHSHGVSIQIAQQGHTALQTLQKQLLKSSGSILSFSRDVLGQLVTISVDLILTFVLSVYMLVYARQIGALARRLMPAGDGTPTDDYPLMVQHAVSGYVRGQLLFSLIMGSSAGVVLEVMGLLGLFRDGSHYAVFFGLFYGLMELIPYIGPILGAVPPLAVALATQPIAALWLLAVFVALQQLEGHLIAPQVFRISLRINPILVILALLLGYQAYGVPGALLALPVATVLRATVIYLRRHLVLEPWSAGQPHL
ncbi:AI-2E family transporter [Conexibacter sp. S30A1]|uniref:AI-2E family transporter n=1 Tax=Conexibacter sp. S30A1 TaxID=2937800 RepID=UPI00200E1C5A|nr:AI-2E family transporter [Conexibacter sp. S30A1]